MKKDFTIQVSRVLATIFIILCHVVQESSNSYVVMTAQFFNIGVYMFLIISGYLYSDKKIEKKNFYLKRFFKIILPIYIFIIPIFILQLINNTFSFKSLIIYILNLQGIFGRVWGASHLWFITAIWFCYLLLPIFQNIKYNKDKKWIKKFNIIIILITVLICYLNRNVGMILGCICTYTIGYFYFATIYKKDCSILFNMLIIIISFVIRIISKLFFDGTVFYDLIIVSITQVIASIFIIKILKILVKKKYIKEYKILDFTDKYSYYIYITHYFFIKSPVTVMHVTPYIIFNIFIMLALTTTYSILLKFVCDYIYKKVGKKYAIK